MSPQFNQYFSLFRRGYRYLFFSEWTKLIELGNRRTLQTEDLPALPQDLDPAQMHAQIHQINWSQGDQILKSIANWGRRELWLAIALFLTFGAMNLTGPILLNHFISNLQAKSWFAGSIYGILIGLAGMIGGIAIQHYLSVYLKLNQKIVNLINTRLYTHALQLSQDSKNSTPVGDIVNHMSSDTDSIAEGAGGLCDFIYNVTVIAGTLVLLFYYLGTTALLSLLLMSVLAPLTRKVSRDFTHFDEHLMKIRDHRVTLMSQILGAIRLVKQFAWESSVENEVLKIRNNELKAREDFSRSELIVTIIYVAVGTFVLFATLSLHLWRGGSFDPALVFTCVSLFGLLEDPFANISRVISQLITARVSAQRVSEFLKQPTIRSSPRPATTIDFKIAGHVLPTTGHFAVIGSVGSGKSTLLNYLLGESERFFSETSLPAGTVSYVPQESYILNGSLLENLKFGNENLSEQEVLSALSAAGLLADVLAMPNGLETEIGEKGINLSGGQKQRLSLARAILNRPDIILLDDPLSAVDPSTEALLVENLLKNPNAVWKNKLVLLTTHRLAHLETFDKILLLKDGRVTAVGDYRQLLESNQDFADFIRVHQATLEHEAQHKPESLLESKKGEEGRLTEDEDRQTGAVANHFYLRYIKSLAGNDGPRANLRAALLIIASMSITFLPMAQKSWLAFVADHLKPGVDLSNNDLTPNLVHGLLTEIASQPLSAIAIYGVLGLLVMLGTLWADLYWLRRGLEAGRSIHASMLKSVLGTKVRFFDATPVGRVLQRFSRDLESIDIHLRWCFEHSLRAFTNVGLTLLLIIGLVPAVLIFFVPIFLVYYLIQKTYRMSSREVKRMDSIHRSPRYAHFKETLQGLTVIRAYNKSDWFTSGFFSRLQKSQQMFYGSYMLNRWFSSRIPVVGGIVSIVTTLTVVWSVAKGNLSEGTASLLTVYSLSFWGVLNWGVRVWSEVESRMTSLERVLKYAELENEELSTNSCQISNNWPERGDVEFVSVKARYSEGRPLILKGVDFKIRGGSRCGIVGRTGSGKSTLFQCLYRFVSLESGQILIDGIDIANLSLKQLRRALAIIPQDPTLFLGTLRDNLDRYKEHSDSEIWRVLELTTLAQFVRGLSQGLNTELVENGANFSQGQRQLVCLARALLMKSKVILLDEATASVDVITDLTIHRVLHDHCKDSTLIMIAHRIGTTRDCHQVIEIDDGRVGSVKIQTPQPLRKTDLTLTASQLATGFDV